MEEYRKKLYLLCASVLPIMICTGMVYTILSIYMYEERGFSLSIVGILFALGAGTGAILSIFLGRASDRFGRKPVLIFSALAFLVVFTSYSIMTEIWQFAMIMMVEGTSWVAIGSATMAYIADIAPMEERGRSMGVYEATWNVGWVLGPLSGGILSDLIGFQKTFMIGAAIILISLVLLSTVVEETAGSKKVTAEESSKAH